MSESIYLGGWEVDFNNEDELRNFIIQHHLNKRDFDIFTTIQSGLEIRTEGGKITEILNQLGSEKVSGPLELKIQDSEPQELFWLKPSLSGEHQLGGKMPPKLKIVTDKTFMPYYLGYLNCQEKHFSWMGLDNLHLFYPLNFYNEPAFIDYSNELKPKLLKAGNKFEYRPKNFLSSLKVTATNSVTIDEIENESDPIHQCGVPLWYQYPEQPKCPKTGELMNFVCSLSSTRKIHLMKKGLLGSKITNEFLMFGDMGTLYIFFHKRSKIAYLTIQC